MLVQPPLRRTQLAPLNDYSIMQIDVRSLVVVKIWQSDCEQHCCQVHCSIDKIDQRWHVRFGPCVELRSQATKNSQRTPKPRRVPISTSSETWPCTVARLSQSRESTYLGEDQRAHHTTRRLQGADGSDCHGKTSIAKLFGPAVAAGGASKTGTHAAQRSQ
jgi:hypothetical protein